MIPHLLQQSRLKHRLGEFLNEQRHPIGFGDDLIKDRLGEGFASCDPLDQRCTLPASEAGQRQRGHMGVPCPRWDKIRPECDD